MHKNRLHHFKKNYIALYVAHINPQSALITFSLFFSKQVFRTLLTVCYLKKHFKKWWEHAPSIPTVSDTYDYYTPRIAGRILLIKYFIIQ